MGSEDLFHKRKAKQAKNLQRRGAHRKAYKRVLIVCEGETEVSYFTDAREHFGLNSVDVKITNKGTFFTIGSVPCFEYWLLLHFTCSTSPLNAKQAETELKKRMPSYKKNKNGLFNELLKELDQAKNNANKSLQTAHANNTDNPSTNVHELIQTLEQLKSAAF